MIKKYSNLTVALIFVIVLNSITTHLNAQKTNSNNLLESYKKNFDSPREVSYVHLNKSTYIKGEMIGLSVYVFDKTSSQLSTNSTNLYCVIEDKNGKRIKEDLLMLVKGVSNTTFKVDSLFTTGTYVLKAYTNWMRNFDEQNYFISPFKVIDPEITKQENSIKNETTKLDIAALPEGGHAIYDSFNTYGIIVKNQFGKGVPLLNAAIIENDTDTLNTFKLNKFGIAKTILNPKNGNSYKVVVKHGDKYHTSSIINIKQQGVIMSVKTMKDKTLVTISNNKNTSPNKDYKLALHNGREINTWEFKIDEQTNQKYNLFDNKLLYKGINILTLFDANDNPLLERLLFSFDGIKTNQITEVKTNKAENDSVKVTMNLAGIDSKKFNNLSVSILPEITKSYNHRHNILSYTLLQPYVKGFVQDPRFYFTNITAKTKYNLDLLLITQGWSSYDWNTIFGKEKKLVYPFEQGISFTAKANDKKTDEYLISPLKNSKSFLVNLDKKDTQFDVQALFPVENDKLRINGIGKRGKPLKPSLYLTFNPAKIPNLDVNYMNKFDIADIDINFNTLEFTNFSLGDDVERLDEVIITGKKKELTKYEKLKNASAGRVVVFDKYMRRDYPDFATWIATQGFNVVQNQGRLSIFNQRRNTLQDGPTSPIVFLDNVQLRNLDVLYNYRMDIIDYIEIDRNAFQMGMQGGFGVIKIKTKPGLILKDNPERNFSINTQIIKFPITFSTEKKFYTPQYQYYDSTFFKEYGVVSWAPNINVNSDGSFDYVYFSPSKEPVTLFIEGITNNDEFVSQIITVETDNP
ncbi:MAG: hypothetical protein HKP48_07075 [Winogradskyella sp.]|uniref:hypothetical protein n=1 Tax=Winogradskyella sp. TaxID=1883156 RepID=UPI0018259AFB|nr:hypothetical protein [Winogradskyella sp.]MBT8245256.1 hypothetical protein [Winogradskyella sp.]NNK23045.1 hypothetical protein [Winogradskyella sp.]